MKISKHVSPYVDDNFFRKSKHDTITLRLISSRGCNLLKNPTVHYVSNEFVDMQRGLDCRHKEGGGRLAGGGCFSWSAW